MTNEQWPKGLPKWTAKQRRIIHDPSNEAGLAILSESWISGELSARNLVRICNRRAWTASRQRMPGLTKTQKLQRSIRRLRTEIQSLTLGTVAAAIDAHLGKEAAPDVRRDELLRTLARFSDIGCLRSITSELASAHSADRPRTRKILSKAISDDTERHLTAWCHGEIHHEQLYRQTSNAALGIDNFPPPVEPDDPPLILSPKLEASLRFSLEQMLITKLVGYCHENQIDEAPGRVAAYKAHVSGVTSERTAMIE